MIPMANPILSENRTADVVTRVNIRIAQLAKALLDLRFKRGPMRPRSPLVAVGERGGTGAPPR